MEKDASKYDDVCLIDSLRALGVKLTYERSGPFRAIADGNRLLQEHSLRLSHANVSDLQGGGRFVVGSSAHFVAFRVLENELHVNFQNKTHTWEKCAVCSCLPRRRGYCEESSRWLFRLDFFEAIFRLEDIKSTQVRPGDRQAKEFVGSAGPVHAYPEHDSPAQVHQSPHLFRKAPRGSADRPEKYSGACNTARTMETDAESLQRKH